MRARYPDREGYVESQGVRVFWEEYGGGDRTVVFIPPWQITHSRIWKMQLAYFARYVRVITFDMPGNGRSERPPTGYTPEAEVGYTLAVMDATATPRASLVCLSRSARTGAMIAADHPQRVERLVLTGSNLADGMPRNRKFDERRERYEGWEKYSRHYWLENYADFAEFFVTNIFTEPHSTKPIDDGVSWALETTPEVLIATVDEGRTSRRMADVLASVRVPTLIVHGTDDAIRPFETAEHAHAAIEGSMLVPFEGAGHCPQARHPVRYNLLVREFVEGSSRPRPAWRRAMARPAARW